jgi:hypothetical protein
MPTGPNPRSSAAKRSSRVGSMNSLSLPDRSSHELHSNSILSCMPTGHSLQSTPMARERAIALPHDSSGSQIPGVISRNIGIHERVGCCSLRRASRNLQDLGTRRSSTAGAAKFQ